MRAEPGPDFRWGIVTRRSKYNRDGTEGSTRRQENAVHGHIRAHEMGRVVAVYSDIASAYAEDAKRPEFENALLDLQAGRIDGIAVWKIDRLVRRAKQYREVLDVLEASGGRLFSLNEGVDTAAEGVSKAITNIVLSILVALAEMESDNTSARLVLMAEERARMGLHQNGSKRPYGHTEDWSALVPAEVERLHEAVERILAGEGITTIAKDWQRRSVPTVTGKPWHAQVLRDILLSPRMVAQREYGGAMFELRDVLPILDLDTWRRVCDALVNRSTTPGPPVQRLLSGIVLCGRCGVALIGGRTSPARGGKAMYVCKRRALRQGGCGVTFVRSEPVDALVGSKVVAFLNDPERVGALLRQHAPGPELAALHERQRELNESLLALDQALKPPPGKPRMPIDRYWSLVEEIETERDGLNRRLAATREAALLAETLSVDWTVEEWESRPLQWQRAIVKLVTERIEIGPGAVAPKGQKGNRFDPDRVHVKFSA